MRGNGGAGRIHASGSLVDLPTGLATAVVLLLTYRLYARTDLPTWRDLAILALAAACP